MCVYAYTFTYLCVCIYIYIYICARTHTHTYTRSRNQSDSFQFYTSGCLPYTAAPRWPLPCGCGQLVWLCWSSYLHGQCRNVTVRTGNVAQVVECLPSKHKVMSSWPKKKKKNATVNTSGTMWHPAIHACFCLLYLFCSGTRVWTQDFMLARQALHYISHSTCLL
jgi:hypothetical protein